MTANFNSWSLGLCLNKSLNPVEPTVPPLTASDLPPSRNNGGSTPATFQLIGVLHSAHYPSFSRNTKTPRAPIKNLGTNALRRKTASAHYEKSAVIARNHSKSSQAPITQGSTYAQNAAQSHPASRNTSATPHFSRGNLCPSTVHTRHSSRIILRGRI